MIKFKEKKLDDSELFELAKSKFQKCVENMYNDYDIYKENFYHHLPHEIHCELAQISYYKNYEIDDLHYFDEVTEFNIQVNLYGYIFDEDGEKELLCHYALIFDEILNVIDDRLV